MLQLMLGVDYNASEEVYIPEMIRLAKLLDIKVSVTQNSITTIVHKDSDATEAILHFKSKQNISRGI